MWIVFLQLQLLRCNVHPLDGLASEARKTMKSHPGLRCNVHTLDGLASEARKTMKSLEATFDVRGNVFGRESAAVNLAIQLKKLKRATSQFVLNDPSNVAVPTSYFIN